MLQQVQRAFILVAVTAGMVGCADDLGSPAGSDLGLLSKIAGRPMLADSQGQGRGDTVACCFPDGTCADMEMMECMDAGGMPQGKGTSCEEVECGMGSDTVACCFPDGTCADMEMMECMEAGGMPQGMGSSCDTTDCQDGGGHHGGGHHGDGHHGDGHHGDGHHDGDEPVACCLPDESCEEMLPHDCMEAGGMPQGMGSSCETVDCAEGGGGDGCGHGGDG